MILKQYIENKGNPFLGAKPIFNLIHFRGLETIIVTKEDLENLETVPTKEDLIKRLEIVNLHGYFMELGLGWYVTNIPDKFCKNSLGYIDCSPKLDAMLGDRFKPLNFT